MGVITRGNKLYVRFKDATGEWQTTRTGLNKGQEAEAEKLLAECEAEARRARGEREPAKPFVETVRTFAEPWMGDRKKEDLDWHADESRLKHHVLPAIGDLPLASVRTRHIVDLIAAVKAKGLAQRTVYNVYSLVTALFRDAKQAEKIDQTPCCLTERQLGARKDKDPEWRAGAVFTRDEAATLISSEKIPADRRVVYALELLAGIRCGEAAGLRFRHWDATKKPLGELVVAYSFNSKKNRAKETKTESVRYVPVHPTLAAILAEWKLSGWQTMMGRKPEPDDLIVPLPPAAAGRRLKREGDPYRSTDYSGRCWREIDLPALEWRHRRVYDLRATFITLALEDGADANVIRDRVTHTKKQRDAFDGYVRSTMWPQTCAEVAKLRLSRGLVTEVVTAAANAGNDSGNQWGPWESHPSNGSRGNSPSRRSSGLVLVMGGTDEDRTAPDCDDSLQRVADPIADDIAAALEARRHGEDRLVRRLLLRALAALDE